MIDSAALRGLLRDFLPSDAKERDGVAQLSALLERHAHPCSRKRFDPGHVTATAVAINEDGAVAMIFHDKLQRWLLPGGHVEAEDESLADAAARELLEETGLKGDPAGARLVDVDVHEIPARGEEPSHLHFDCKFLFAQPEGAAAAGDGAGAFAWLAPAEIFAREDLAAPLKRAVRKAIALHTLDAGI